MQSIAKSLRNKSKSLTLITALWLPFALCFNALADEANSEANLAISDSIFPLVEPEAVRKFILETPFKEASIISLPRAVIRFYAPQQPIFALHKIFAIGNEPWQKGCMKFPDEAKYHICFYERAGNRHVLSYQYGGYCGGTKIDVFELSADGGIVSAWRIEPDSHLAARPVFRSPLKSNLSSTAGLKKYVRNNFAVRQMYENSVKSNAPWTNSGY